MCGCSNCNSTITSTKGEKGDPGVTGPPGPQGAPGTPYSGLAVIIDSTGTTLTLTPAQTGSTVLLDRSAGTAVGLPVSPPIGTYYVFDVTAPAGVGSYVITSGGANLISGFLYVNKTATAPTLFSAANSDLNTILTLNGTTTGGLVGTQFTMTYVAANTWLTSGVTMGSGVLATPFSHP